MITAFDSEGESETFIIALMIQPSLTFDFVLILIIIGVIVVTGIITLSLIIRKKRKSRLSSSPEAYYEQVYGDESTEEFDDYTKKYLHYCPYCGYKLVTLRNFCPSCGKSLKLQE
jgi:hypothetical protein